MPLHLPHTGLRKFQCFFIICDGLLLEKHNIRPGKALQAGTF